MYLGMYLVMYLAIQFLFTSSHFKTMERYDKFSTMFHADDNGKCIELFRDPERPDYPWTVKTQGIMISYVYIEIERKISVKAVFKSTPMVQAINYVKGDVKKYTHDNLNGVTIMLDVPAVNTRIKYMKDVPHRTISPTPPVAIHVSAYLGIERIDNVCSLKMYFSKAPLSYISKMKHWISEKRPKPHPTLSIAQHVIHPPLPTPAPLPAPVPITIPEKKSIPLSVPAAAAAAAAAAQETVPFQSMLSKPTSYYFPPPTPEPLEPLEETQHSWCEDQPSNEFIHWNMFERLY